MNDFKDKKTINFSVELTDIPKKAWSLPHLLKSLDVSTTIRSSTAWQLVVLSLLEMMNTSSTKDSAAVLDWGRASGPMITPGFGPR